MGAARDFGIERFGGVTVARDSTLTVGTTAVEVVKGDPDRLELDVVNFGTAEVVIRPGRGVTTTAGYRIAPGGTLSFRVDLDGDTLADRFEAISSAAGQSVYVHELVRLREGAA